MVRDQDKALVSVSDAIEAMRRGETVIMVDDEDRENEGDLVFAAEHVTPEKINFMAKDARGLICLAMEPQLIDKLKLPMMEDAAKDFPHRRTAFTVSIEAKHGVTTGISAHDRSTTVQAAIADSASPTDIVVPGHIFPLKSRPGGVLERAGHTEGSVDLARLAGFKSAAVICEIMNDDGSMARLPDLVKFAARHNIKIVSIADLITYRLLRESLVEIVEKTAIHTAFGNFEAVVAYSIIDQCTHVALIKGNNFANQVVDVRVHQQRALPDALLDAPDVKNWSVASFMKNMQTAECAVLVYLVREHNRDDLRREIAEIALDDEVAEKLAPPPMALRQYGVGAQILRALGVRQMRLHANSPRSIKALAGFGLEIVETVLRKDA